MKSLPVIISAGIESVINGFVSLDPAIISNITPLIGNVVAIEVTDFQITLYLLFGTDSKIQVMSRYDNEVDVRIMATSISLTRMGMSKTPNKLVLSGDVKIEGDVEKAAQVKEFMAAMHLDWEEQLSKITGDVIAHQAGNAARGIAAWGLSALQSLSADTSEYVKYEKELVPTQHEVQAFINSVDVVRNDIERMDARINRLINQAINKKAVNTPGASTK